MTESEAAELRPRSRWERARAAIRSELASRPSVYILIAVFCVLGPVLARMIFPEASTALVLFGGVALGIVFAFSALAGRILE